MLTLRWRGLLLLVLLVVDVTASPYKSLSADTLPLKRQKRQDQETIDNNDLKCLLLESCSLQVDPFSPETASPPPLQPQGVPGFQPPDLPPFQPEVPLPPEPEGPSPPVSINTPAPSCTCTPHWQCRDKTSAKVVTGDPLSSVVLDLRSNLGCISPEDVCCVEVDPHATPPTPPPATFRCGQRNVLGVGNTFLGFEDRQTQFGEFPWTVVITSSRPFGDGSNDLFLAGGSLVHPYVVMSTAHKLKDLSASQLMVRIGDWNLATTTEAIPHQEIRVTEVLIHPGYSGEPYQFYDVVLLVLDQPAILGATVNTICLPLSEQDYVPEDCVVTGWGKKNFNDKSKYQEVMKAVSMPLVRHDICQAALQRTRLGPGFILHDAFLCAGGEVEGQDACTGDGGSPLVCPLRSDSSRYVQVGVVSWGIECGRKGRPGVYVDVLKVGLWIDQVLNDKFGSTRGEEAARKPVLDPRTSV